MEIYTIISVKEIRAIFKLKSDVKCLLNRTRGNEVIIFVSWCVNSITGQDIYKASKDKHGD